MQSVLMPVMIYLFLLLLFRLSGKKTLSQATPFGLVLILLISTSVADAMKAEDRSVTGAILMVISLICTHLLLSNIKFRSKRLAKVTDDMPTLLVKDGYTYEDRLKDTKTTRQEILAAARQQKIIKIEDIRYAILEIDGTICVVPKEEKK